MLQYPNIDPVAFTIPLGVTQIAVHWYGIMYILAFASAWFVAVRRTAQPFSVVKKAQVEDLITYGAFGVIIGGRLGYALFYGMDKLLADPVWLFKLWEGGMSFHGGLLGVVVAMALYARKIQVRFTALMDFVAPIVPLGLGFGRLGNFIGQELWGRVTEHPWGMVFPKALPEGLARHPSQLYQAFLEGLVLFVIVYWFSRKPRPRCAVSGVFLIFYAIFRFLVEFVREPDEGIGLMGWMTRGQLLCIPMLFIGIGLVIYAYKLAETKVSPRNALS